MCFKVSVVLNIHPLLNMELSYAEITGSQSYLPCPWDSKFSVQAAWRKGRTLFMQYQFTLSVNWFHLILNVFLFTKSLNNVHPYFFKKQTNQLNKTKKKTHPKPNHKTTNKNNKKTQNQNKTPSGLALLLIV